MMHKTRIWNLQEVGTDLESLQYLARKLSQYTFCACNAYHLGKYTLLNDASSGDGAQEYAVLLDGRQIESITFGWVTTANAYVYLKNILAGEYDGADYGHFKPNFNHPEYCRHCA